MSHRVTLTRYGQTLEVAPGKTILDTALEAGIDYPFGCQSGLCGSCKSHLIRGEVALEPYEETALAPEERAQGLILACRAMPKSDCEVTPIDLDEPADHPLRSLECAVSALDDATHDIKRVALRVRAGGPYAFTAGQYAEVTFPGQQRRDFSMANRPDEEMLEFHVRRMAGGAVSEFVATKLKVGDAVQVRGPFGAAYLRTKHTGPIIACAGGSGLAPIKSIVETALKAGLRQHIYLYFGARDARDLYLVEHFAGLAKRHDTLTFIPVLSAPSAATPHRTGFLHEAVGADFTDLDGCQAYLAGPPVMVEACVGALTARGMRREDCHADPFFTDAEKKALLKR
ncbi:MAG: 2Fe-2S iron-sulfur cluster binding domain-containing protein [Alphaproteobacteria bacterium]|nr:2Fe-2S iron-sulfur cluster binding domain-containing protein [Alphaproteobacteria bacterium]